MTIFEAYNSTKKKLEKIGIEDFVFEAKQIIKHITGLDATRILTNYNKSLTQFQENNLTAILRQREIRYPLQYIFGEWDFYGRSFKVGPGVLVPRADTETLVEHSLKFLSDKENPSVLDLCAGSGCIGITIGKEREKANVLMIEKYKEAISYAEKNIEKNSAQNVSIELGDVFEKSGAEKKYDLIVSNPPYIPIDEMDIVSPETKFEPETALIAENNGLQFYEAITENYKNSLKNGGMLCFEVGINESVKVAEILKNQGFTNIETLKDLNGIDRVVSGIYETEEM